jgi:hypothetical protein
MRTEKSMAKNPRTDPTLTRLVRAVDEASDAALPVELSVHGTRFEGDLLSETAYYAILTQENPLLGALDPNSELADRDYAGEHADAPTRYIHLMLSGAGEPARVWRVRQDAVDAWSLRPLARRTDEDSEPGVLSRLFGRVEA